MKKIFLTTAMFLVLVSSASAEIKVLFDNTHAQIAGSAHWTIVSGYSSFADHLSANGYQVNSLNVGPITPETLREFDVFVIPEPNNPFSEAEISTIKKFTSEGGGLLLIGDHFGADRNNNGWDAVRIYNEFTGDFGFTFDKKTMSEHPIAYKNKECSVTNGVDSIGAWGGTSISVLAPESVMKLFSFSEKYGGNPYIVIARYGTGRIAAIGDSSPFDDGTKDTSVIPPVRLYNNYHMTQHDHPQMGLGLVNWCSGRSGSDIVLTPKAP
ncbi:MAG: hypothetical protein PHQ23_09655 [Candidatus Wallbacteria bacterium]|nr:hypothetical protein [Candidatus Wallbacteria bacterium]